MTFWGLFTFFPIAHATNLEALFAEPPSSASPWVFWYWMNGCVSREGITADLEAMKEVGLGGAYLMPIKGPTELPLIDPPLVQLTSAWWDMVRHAMSEADRLGLQIAMHACDGFAVAGGPWITPEISMQKVVWSTTEIEGGHKRSLELPRPDVNEGYYQEIAVLAFPLVESAQVEEPKVTISLPEFDAQFLTIDQDDQRVRMEVPGWIQFAYEEPFLCSSITITPDGNNYQAHRLLLQASDDGESFHTVGRLEPPRHGWQNGAGIVTHAIEPTTAKCFRLVFDKDGSEPGSEDLDSAKWSPVLKVKHIEISPEPRINQFRGKTGEVWRVSSRSSSSLLSDEDCVPLSTVIDLTDALDDQGRLTLDVPGGSWTILRLGHTSTGTRNETGGGGKGLECDKLNPLAVRLQFDCWFGEAIRQIGPELASRVLKIFHVDSWECGSQNWTPSFRGEFEKRRGYDPLLYLPAMAGIPVESADVSERFLYDLRLTISELLIKNFFGTMDELAHENGCQFSAECVAPTMLADGMRHFAEVDIPMGEFWLRSPTHDKPNDIRDAVSAAHVYGKPLVQAEAFTELRMNWDEHPAMLKSLGDRQYCLGINRFVYHVFTHNPWLDRRPGMTLDNVGLYFQRDQTWWRSGKAWVDYARRCQAMLQCGHAVVDIAVFTGEEMPRRAVLPERLVSTLPGIMGKDTVEHEVERLANRGVPLRELPPGVKHSANMTDQADWIDPLRGYAYDSVNHDALLRLAKVREKRIEFPGGASYGLLVVPISRPLSPNSRLMTPELAHRLIDLVQAGAQIVICAPPKQSPSFSGFPGCDSQLRKLVHQLLAKDQNPEHDVGQGRVIRGPIQSDSFADLGLEPDFIATTPSGDRVNNIGWAHRRAKEGEIYFVSNQASSEQQLNVSLRTVGKVPELWDPVSGRRNPATTWQMATGRTLVPIKLAPHESVFVVFRRPTELRDSSEGPNWIELRHELELEGSWKITFDPELGGPKEPLEFANLVDWTTRPEEDIRFFSGTCVYRQKFYWTPLASDVNRYWLELGKVADLASVKLNDIECGVAWTAPYRIEVTDALRPGMNDLEIKVTNTWVNRLLGDQSHPDAPQWSWTTAPPLPKNKTLREAGLIGPVILSAQ
ncbi:hypothetical protein Pla144_24920 [Bythopirellula polymerisocia]|uniref:Beta-mannosidase-like galactose-binding domain-containing protein n=1 Tax=Bythopirellula polymerisocia TaxID=2528003 RepID=A0A5C6CV69_9BACT|nr:hypothetical protein Pla144_24920 [Bythopirellula polymerisocia]